MIAASEVKNQLSRESMWFQFFFRCATSFFPVGIFYSFKTNAIRVCYKEMFTQVTVLCVDFVPASFLTA